MDHRGLTSASPALARHIWSKLTRREYTVARSFSEGGRESVLLLAAPSRPEAITPRNLNILERTLLGVDRKCIAAELGISVSTVAQVLRHALDEMGLDCTPARTPLPLVALVHAAFTSIAEEYLLFGFDGQGEAESVLLSSNFDPAAWSLLAPAERAVLCDRLSGKTYAAIAKNRNTSIRTVANQVAAANRRLGVSGRLGVLHSILQVTSHAAAE